MAIIWPILNLHSPDIVMVIGCNDTYRMVSRDQGHGLMYRGLDDQVGTPIENATVFKATGKFSTPLELGINQYLFI